MGDSSSSLVVVEERAPLPEGRPGFSPGPASPLQSSVTTPSLSGLLASSFQLFEAPETVQPPISSVWAFPSLVSSMDSVVF